MIKHVAILTGDLIQSRRVNPSVWVESLKIALSRFGKEPKDWEMYRGDGFQLMVEPREAILAAIYIKAKLKMVQKLDVRIAIGIGEISYFSDHLLTSNGDAFINSGACFERLKKHTLQIQTNNEEFNITMNLMLSLAAYSMDNWTKLAAEIIVHIIENPTFTQQEIANLMNKSQSNISTSLKRAGFDEVQKLMNYFETKIEAL